MVFVDASITFITAQIVLFRWCFYKKTKLLILRNKMCYVFVVFVAVSNLQDCYALHMTRNWFNSLKHPCNNLVQYSLIALRSRVSQSTFYYVCKDLYVSKDYIAVTIFHWLASSSYSYWQTDRPRNSFIWSLLNCAPSRLRTLPIIDKRLARRRV